MQTATPGKVTIPLPHGRSRWNIFFGVASFMVPRLRWLLFGVFLRFVFFLDFFFWGETAVCILSSKPLFAPHRFSRVIKWIFCILVFIYQEWKISSVRAASIPPVGMCLLETSAPRACCSQHGQSNERSTGAFVSTVSRHKRTFCFTTTHSTSNASNTNPVHNAFTFKFFVD